MLAGVCGCVLVVSGFGVVVGSWALNTQMLPIANEKLSIINNKLFLTIVFPPHARSCAPVCRLRYGYSYRGFWADNKEGTLILYHSKRQISTIFR
jgi:hypothetical protein